MLKKSQTLSNFVLKCKNKQKSTEVSHFRARRRHHPDMEVTYCMEVNHFHVQRRLYVDVYMYVHVCSHKNKGSELNDALW